MLSSIFRRLKMKTVDLERIKFHISNFLCKKTSWFLLGSFIGWVVIQGSVIMSFLIGATAIFGLILFFRVHIKLFTVQRILLYLTIVAGFIGPAFLSIPVGPIHIFPYRVLLPILWFILIAHILARRGKLSISHIKVNHYLRFFGVWLIYAVLSIAWAFSKDAAIIDITFLLSAVSMIFFMVYYLSNDIDLKNFYYLWLTIFCGMLLLGIWEHLTGQHLPVSGYYNETRARFMFRPTGVFKNPNDYATFLAISIPFGISTLRYARNVLVRLFGLGLAIVAFYLIVVTGSRANILAVLLELGVLTVLLTKLSKKVYVTVALAICLAMGLMFLHGSVQDFSSQVSGELSSLFTQAELNTGSVAIRTNLVRNGLVFLYSSVGMGVGAGNAEYWMANFPKYNTLGIINPHNWWLEILVNYGVLIFIGYALMYTKIIRSLWRLWNEAKNRRERMITESLLTALIGFFFASVSPSSVMAFNPQWFLFAFALAFINWRQFS